MGDQKAKHQRVETVADLFRLVKIIAALATVLLLAVGVASTVALLASADARSAARAAERALEGSRTSLATVKDVARGGRQAVRRSCQIQNQGRRATRRSLVGLILLATVPDNTDDPARAGRRAQFREDAIELIRKGLAPRDCERATRAIPLPSGP